MAPELDTQDSQDEEQPEKGYTRMKREDIRALEESAARGKEADRLARELVFAKAGIDTDSKLGRMLFTAYDGELTKEAIIAEARDIGLLEGKTDSPDIPKDEKDSTRERQTLSSGANPPGDNPITPQQEALDKAKSVVEEGGKYEHAAGAYISTLVQRYADGDQRAVVNPNDRFNRGR